MFIRCQVVPTSTRHFGDWCFFTIILVSMLLLNDISLMKLKALRETASIVRTTQNLQQITAIQWILKS